jgi:hypothetical protein
MQLADHLLVTSVEHASFMLRHGGMPMDSGALLLTPGRRDGFVRRLRREGLPVRIEAWGVEDLLAAEGCVGTEQFPVPEAFDSARIVSDAIPHFLVDREPGWRLRGNFLNGIRMARVARNAARLLSGLGIRRVICCSTPHELLTYLFGRTAEQLGLELLILDKSPLLHRYWALGGMRNRPPVGECRPPPSGASVSDRTERFVSALRSADAVASEIGLQGQKSIYGGESMSVLGEIRRDGLSLLRYPWRIASVVRKVRLHSTYSSLCRALPGPETKVVSFFLHYQPERTTLPEGGIFVLQQLAIEAISAGIPEDWAVCVREHPSTWFRRLSLVGRDEYFYRSIAAIPKVRMVSNGIPTRDLIDRSEIVATITGKVGFQALCRGRVALVFGDAGYRTHPRCVTACNSADVRRAVTLSASPEQESIRRDRLLYEYLVEVEAASIEECQPIGSDSPYDIRLATMQALIRRIVSGTSPSASGPSLVPPPGLGGNAACG